MNPNCRLGWEVVFRAPGGEKYVPCPKNPAPLKVPILRNQTLRHTGSFTPPMEGPWGFLG